jgi:hypothetical protein
MMAARILEILLPVFAIVAAGSGYGFWKRPDMSTANQLLMDLFTPALIFQVLTVHDLPLDAYGPLALGGIVVVLGSGLLVLPVVGLLPIQGKTFLPPMMFTNSGNLGLPLAVFAFGDQALPAAVILFLVENLLHLTVGIYLLNPRAGVLHLAKVPMIQATVAGLAVNLAGWSLPGPLALALQMLGQVAIPLMLFSLGVRLLDIHLRHWPLGLLGALLCPLVGLAAALGARPFLGLPPLEEKLLLLFGALPPAVLNYLFADRYQQEPAKVASIVLLGNLASLVSIPLVLAWVLW